MVKVLTDVPASSAIRAVTAEEWTPPDRKAPTGTSATRRRRTATLSSSRASSASCAGSAAWGVTSPGDGKAQYRVTEGGSPGDTSMKHPGGSFRTPWNAVRGDGTYCSER